ncbi:ferredoxin--NADP reductase [Sinomicrobium weinanense]|uniref:Ferredoxin--NADP reductase n=1 Tax=Sinomicrobium weinanense TaxID=2842200 RepID=A0A926Q3G9_9FLAO|nr:ferredoxin--NADP reductase [Sinomicrobium weinanense]MBC9796914.1 ferredoxin--NADP reductase [Sinomicrobium weinanense]MBU3124222.1 ferredoxin--NADP reductase [Sinomicrobium weinanense]
MLHFHSLRVSRIERNTPKSVTITFDIPEDLREEYRHEAGQHITIKKEFDGEEIRRSYSICTSPGEGKLSVGIKEIPEGVFSGYANQSLREGDTLEVHPPEGHFTFSPDASQSRTVAAFAAGSGITPVLSILKALLEEEPQSKFVLIYGNRSTTETMFFEEINDLAARYPERFTVYFTYSRSEEDNALFGRIEHSTVNYVMKNKHKDTIFDAFYLCGPEDMIHTVSDTLRENGVDEKKIYFELFTTSEEAELDENLEGQTKVKVIVDDEEFEFTMPQSERVLDAALDNDIDAPYSCQGGICSSCLARVTEGQVKMVKNQILTDSEVAEGLVLTCQSHPVTPKLTIDYDDV